MFTGIVAAVGQVRAVRSSSPSASAGSGVLVSSPSLELELATGMPDLTLGESVAINGVCLTVTRRDSEGSAYFDVSPETLDKTNLGSLRPGDRINLERALLPTERLSGHLVQGHVDAVGTWLGAESLGDYWKVRVAIPRGLERYCIVKGSIALDGTSLTINTLQDTPNSKHGAEIELLLIPHTWTHTRLSELQPGAPINIEVDLIVKYTERLLACRT